MQRQDRSGDRQPARGDRVDLGKEILKADQYPTMKRVMELMQEGLRINIANESRASGNRSTLLPAHEVEALPSCPGSPEFDATRDLRSCHLFEGDLKKPTNVRAPQMQALTRLLNVGRYRAKGYPAPMEWAFREKLVKYVESGPDLPREMEPSTQSGGHHCYRWQSCPGRQQTRCQRQIMRELAA